MGPQHYALGIGSNRWHGRHGSPRKVLIEAVAALRQAGIVPTATAPTFTTPPLGPGGRCYANSALIVATSLDPPTLLAELKRIERSFGRRRGRRWGARVIDLDILLWSGGRWRSSRPALVIPHPELAKRRFVLDPLAAIAADWHLPRGASVRQLRARLTRRRPIHRSITRSGP